MTVVNKAESFLPAIEQNARDHQVLIVEGFRNLFSISALRPQKISGLEIIGEATDGLDAVQQIKTLNPDLILVDVSLPTLNGIEAFRRITQLNPESKLLSVRRSSQRGSPWAAFLRHTPQANSPGYRGRTWGRLYVSSGIDRRDCSPKIKRIDYFNKPRNQQLFARIGFASGHSVLKKDCSG